MAKRLTRLLIVGILLLVLAYGGLYFAKDKQANNSLKIDQAAFTSCIHNNSPYHTPSRGYFCPEPGKINHGFLGLPTYAPNTGTYN